MIRIGTFNLNNLFDRFNFHAAVTENPRVRVPIDGAWTRAETFCRRLRIVLKLTKKVPPLLKERRQFVSS